MKETAIILTNGLLDQMYAKTCHGLLRGTERYSVLAVIDNRFAGKTTADVLTTVDDVPIFAAVTECLDAGIAPKWCIVGVAFEGGRMPEDFRQELLVAVRHGISVVNGLHTLLCDDKSFMQEAAAYGVEVLDIRKPKGIDDLHFWTGKIKDVRAPRIAVLGMDCAVGKRTTCKMLTHHLRSQGREVEMIYTGQTGWLEGHRYGCIFDSTLNDFVSGELEHAVYQCDKEVNPDIMLIEGQSSLRNPSGPCGSEMIVSLQSRHVILQHDPDRLYFDDDASVGISLPSVQSEIDLIAALGAEVIAVTVRPGSHADQLETLQRQLEVPVIEALPAGISQLADIVMQKCESN